MTSSFPFCNLTTDFSKEGLAPYLAETPNTESCAICLESLEPGLLIKGCRHVFHEDCLAHWTERANTCPMCCVVLFIPREMHTPDERVSNALWWAVEESRIVREVYVRARENWEEVPWEVDGGVRTVIEGVGW